MGAGYQDASYSAGVMATASYDASEAQVAHQPLHCAAGQRRSLRA